METPYPGTISHLANGCSGEVVLSQDADRGVKEYPEWIITYLFHRLENRCSSVAWLLIWALNKWGYLLVCSFSLFCQKHINYTYATACVEQCVVIKNENCLFGWIKEYPQYPLNTSSCLDNSALLSNVYMIESSEISHKAQVIRYVFNNDESTGTSQCMPLTLQGANR